MGNIEVLARNYFRAEAEAASWLEGFAEKVSGDSLTYVSPRDPQSPALMVRAWDGHSTMEWLTAPVPTDWRAGSATFVWGAGLGCGSGTRRFDVRINGQPQFSFYNSLTWEWTIPGTEGASLAFFGVELNPDGDLFGYLRLTAPRDWLQPGHPLRISITGESAASSAWVMTLAFTDTVAHLREEIKPLYCELSFRHGGGPSALLAARPEWRGRTVSLRDEADQLGRATLQDWGAVAGAMIRLPSPAEHQLGPLLRTTVEGEYAGEWATPDLGKACLLAFFEEELQAERYVFPPGPLPGVDWKRPAMVSNELGPCRWEVSYYDAAMNPVQAAVAPGRYGAVVRATLPDGFTIQRYLTLCCTSPDWDPGRDLVQLAPHWFESCGISAGIGQAHQDMAEEFVGDLVVSSIRHSPQAAGFLAGLWELAGESPAAGEDIPEYRRNARNRDRQWWVSFKYRKVDAASCRVSERTFIPPTPGETLLAPQLTSGDPSIVGFTPADIEGIREVSRQWAGAGHEPLNVLVAHRGVIVLHEAFGTLDGGPMSLDTPTTMASITKWMTGTLMMEFVDQELVDLEAPVRHYLPELRPPSGRDMTVRDLFSFSAGFWSHGVWGADFNHAYENYVGQYLPFLEIGVQQQYTGGGHVLAGKIMERISGRAIPYLFQECLFRPLGAQHTRAEGTPTGSRSTALDIGRWMQMIVNRGNYGSTRFFSPETFEKMLPVKLDRLVPGLAGEGGIGCQWGGGLGFSPKTLACGAASGAIVRADVDNQLVVVMCRNRLGDRYGDFPEPFLKACAAPLSNQT